MIAHCLLADFRIKGEWFSVKPSIAVETVYKSLDMVKNGIGPDAKYLRQRWRRDAERLYAEGLVHVHVQIPHEVESELYKIVSDWRADKDQHDNKRGN